MSNAYFPTFATTRVESRTPFFDTSTQKGQTGTRFAIRRREVGYRYVLALELRAWLSEHTTMSGFFEAHGGSYESFLYVDPMDGVTRRVVFTDDALDLRFEPGGLWSGTVELETVVV